MKRNILVSLAAIVACSGLASAQQVTHEATKKVKFTWKPNQAVTAIGTAIFGENYALDKNLGPPGDTLDATGVAFQPSVRGDSFPAQWMQAMHGGASGTTTITVGRFTSDDRGAVMVDGTIHVKTIVPPNGPPNKGGKAIARGKINIPGGKMRVRSLTVDGANVTLTKTGTIPANPRRLMEGHRLYVDPISISLSDPDTGEMLFESNIFEMFAESENFADIGLNDQDLLSLSNDPSAGGWAEFGISTPEWATDLNGSVSLRDGIFEATGLFAPDSGDLSEYWNFIIVDDLVLNATLRDDVLTDSFNADQISIDFAPGLGWLDPDREVAVMFSMSAHSEIETAPAPASMALLGLGGLVAARRRRPRDCR